MRSRELPLRSVLHSQPQPLVSSAHSSARLSVCYPSTWLRPLSSVRSVQSLAFAHTPQPIFASCAHPPDFFPGEIGKAVNCSHVEAKYWTELRGTKLFLYNDKKQEKYTDSIELRNLTSVNDGYSNQKQWAEVVLTLDKEEVIIKTEIAEDAEEWKGFILTVVKHSVPSSLTLLPGQLIRLKEVLEKETARRAEEKSPLLLPPRKSVDIPSFESYEDVDVSNAMPLCFYTVSRHEAAEMLVKNESFGNLILRPGGDSKNYAVTIREPSENSSRTQVKHYKILKTDRGFTIELDKPVILNSLDDVVNHFIRETRGKLKPYVSNIYDTQIDYAVNVETKKTADRFMPAQRGTENSYVNVFPGN